MLVYRVEHRETGYGPYDVHNPSATEYRTVLCSDHNDSEHPGYWRDKLLPFEDVLNDECRCACASIPLLKQWFGRWINTLDNSGFICVVYDVDDNHMKHGESKRQLIFDINYAVKVDVIPLYSLIEDNVYTQQ